MDSLKLVSIIIPIYNVEKHLDQCITSVLNQSYRNLQIILINDGSTDSSGKICENWKKKDERIIVYHQINSGVSVARNNGIKIAKGYFIFFLDSDDFIDKGVIEELVLNYDKDIVVGINYKNVFKKTLKMNLNYGLYDNRDYLKNIILNYEYL